MASPSIAPVQPAPVFYESGSMEKLVAFRKCGSEWAWKRSWIFYHNTHHRPTAALFNGFKMMSIADGMAMNGELVFAQIGLDSMALFWKYEFETNLNPIKRIKDYARMNALKANTAELLFAIKSFLENQEKVYGMQIHHQMVTDTLLISTKQILPRYPDNDQIYSMIGSLENTFNPIRQNKPVFR